MYMTVKDLMLYLENFDPSLDVRCANIEDSYLSWPILSTKDVEVSDKSFYIGQDMDEDKKGYTE